MVQKSALDKLYIKNEEVTSMFRKRNNSQAVKYGTFGGENGIPFAKIGNGEKIMLIAIGGPGNTIEKGLGLSMYSNPFKSFRDQYTQYIISRKSALPKGYTIEDMADDYAELITNHFQGSVDIIIGISFGGMILTEFCSKYPHLAKKIVIVVAAHKITPEGMKVDTEYAKLMAEGKNARAMAKFAPVLTQNFIILPFLKGLLFCAGLFMKPAKSQIFASDIVIEAETQLTYDSSESLRNLTTPIWVLAGSQDYYFPVELFHEMTKLSKYVNMTIFPKAGHNLMAKKGFIEELSKILAD